jgi:hypothetical protein
MRYLIPSILAGVAGLILVGCAERPQQAAPPVADKSPTDKSVGDKPLADKKDSKESDEEKEIREALAKLSPEDRKLAEKQRFCVVHGDSRLGEMGPPIKLDVKGRAVFICCKSCQKTALADPDKTLTQLDKLTQPAKK